MCSFVTATDLEAHGISDHLYGDISTLLNTAQVRIVQAVESELPIELRANHTAADLTAYEKLVATHGFTSDETQRWLQTTVPAYQQIIIEQREIVLGDIVRSRE